ncbi:ABC transporter permease subunit [Bremerella sp. JC817]|uniref:ABC transporter permease subunit n=1 Tax=Bremerella sp. JC817 TaxID=3231756 RepID=UPI003459BB3D
MNLAMLRQVWRESRLLMLGCSIALFAFCWIRVWIVGRIDMSRFQGILEILRPEFENFSAVDFEHALTYPGRVAFTFTEPMVIILVVAWAIARGSDSVSGPLGRGTMEMMLSQPVSRFQYLMSKNLVCIFGTLLIAASAYAGIAGSITYTSVKKESPPIKMQIPLVKIEVEIPFTKDPNAPTRMPLSDFVDRQDMIPSALNLMGLGLFFGGFTTLMSAWDQYRWRTIAIAAGFLIIQLMLRVLSLSMEDVAWLKYTTIFSLYEPEVLVSYAVHSQDAAWSFLFEKTAGDWRLGGLGYLTLLGGTGLLGFATGTWVFCRRDLPAPV